MAKRKVKNKIGLPYNRFDGEGESMNMIQKSGAVANDAFDSSNLGGTIGSIGSGVTSIVKAGMNNAQIADTSSIQDQIKAQNNMVVGASDNASLLNEWSHLSMLKDNYSWKDIRGGSNANRAMNTIGGAAQGAMTGATVGGPIGAIAGAVIGLGSGIAGWITGNKKAKRRARRLNQQASDANERALLSFENRASDVDTQNDLNIESNFFNDGGPITMRYTGVMSPFGNTFGDGGIFIKPENRGKFTALKERTGKSSTWYKEHGTPAQKKMAIFALNAAKWKHADGGPLDSLVSDINSRSKADFVQRLLDPNRAYISDWESNRIATHKLSYATDDNGAIVFPNVQRINGKLYDFTDPKNKRGKWDALDSAIERGDTLRMTPAQADEFTKTYKRYYPKGKTFKAFGGELHTQGGDFTNGLTYIDNGGSHEANPFEGVQMGIDPQGVPNLVEEGEVIFNDYVFSDRMKLPKKLKEKYNIKGETFADAAKELSKESEERPNDPISKRGLQAFMSALANGQEEVRIKNEGRQMNRYAKGGKLGKRYDGDGPDDNYMDFGTLASPISYEQLERMIDLGIDGSAIPLTGTSEEIDDAITRAAKKGATTGDKSNLSYLRFAPAFMSGMSAFTDLFSKPDYSAANRIASVDIQPALVSADPIGQYLSYKPLDRMFYINQLNKNTAAGRRAIQNTSGGNRAAALAGILAADYNYGENLGKLARQAEEYNQNLREKTATFNRATDMFNSQQSLTAQTTNASSRNDATKMRLAQAEEVAKLRSAAKSAYDTRRSSNLNNFINNLGNIGWEDYQRRWIEDNPGSPYFMAGNGDIIYKGITRKNGGKLNKKRGGKNNG